MLIPRKFKRKCEKNKIERKSIRKTKEDKNRIKFDIVFLFFYFKPILFILTHQYLFQTKEVIDSLQDDKLLE